MGAQGERWVYESRFTERFNARRPERWKCIQTMRRHLNHRRDIVQTIGIRYVRLG